MQGQTWLLLHWHSFQWGNSDIVKSIFAHKGGHSFEYGFMVLHSPLINQDGKPEMIDAQSSATIQVSVRNTRVFGKALTAVMNPHTLWQRITHFLWARWRVAFHIYLLYVASGMWLHISTIRMTCALHSSQGLQLCCSCFRNTWRCLFLSSADGQILPLRYCYISHAVLFLYMFSFEILSIIAIQSSLWIHRLPFHLLRHYHILQVWNILSNLHTF